MYFNIPKVITYLDIETPKLLIPSADKSVAVEVFGHQKRFKLFNKEIFNKKHRILTGNLFKLVCKMDPEVMNFGMLALNGLKRKSENVIWFDINSTMEPYEYEPYMQLSTEITDNVESK